MSKIVQLFISAIAFVAIGFASEFVTWGFTVGRVITSHDLGFTNKGIDPTPLLQQPFTLKAQGGQSYVFFSHDGAVVLKLFKEMPRPWFKKESYQKKKWGKLRRTLTGYELAYDKLAEETALLTLHFKPTSSPLPVQIVDRLGISHTVDLSSTYFVLQKRASTLSFDQFQNHLPAIRQLLQKQAAAHIVDHDTRLLENIGWSDGAPVFIDPGRFTHE